MLKSYNGNVLNLYSPVIYVQKIDLCKKVNRER